MANGDDSLIHLLHTIWSAALSLLGGFVWWNWTRMADTVDKKLDKEEFERFLDRMDKQIDQQQNQHVENRRRLDTIVNELRKRGTRG